MINKQNKFSLLVQSFLDMSPHPAWISDSGNTLALNQRAKDMTSQGISLTTMEKEPGLIASDGKRFIIRKSEMNHGTNCVLNELYPDDDVVNRMRALTAKMDKSLNAA